MITYQTDLERALLKDKERLDFLEADAVKHGFMNPASSLREYIDKKMAAELDKQGREFV